MRRRQGISGMRLRLLAAVLALAIFWYAVTPAPDPARSAKKSEEPSDEERHDAEYPLPMGYGLGLIESSVTSFNEQLCSVGEEADADCLQWL